jgi:V-type H+-transporting ATPase S1 subunit
MAQIFRQFLPMCFLFAGTLAGSDRVPVLLWTNDESTKYPDVLAGHTVTTDDFNSRYVQPVLADKIDQILVVFIQDKLSVADISHYADVYGYSDGDDSFTNVKSIMTELSSTHLPNVLSPLKEFDDPRLSKQVLKDPYNLDVLSLEPGKRGNVVMVKLPDTRSGDYRQALSRNDKIIGSVTAQLQALNRRFTAIYTALRSNQGAEQDTKVSLPRRQLLAPVAPETLPYNGSAFFNISNTIYMYSGGIAVSFSDKPENQTWLNLEHLEANEAESFCDDNSTTSTNKSCTLFLTYNSSVSSVQTISDISFRFEFVRSGDLDPGYWIIDRFLMTYMNGSDQSTPVQAEMDLSVMTDWTPVGLSYSCSQVDQVKPRNTTAEGSKVFLMFQHFQIQAYGVTEDHFGHYNDCQGFFSIGIWMAIICIAVLIAIVLFGIIMLSSITTMDRYDDPKGKTIMVAVGTD